MRRTLSGPVATAVVLLAVAGCSTPDELPAPAGDAAGQGRSWVLHPVQERQELPPVSGTTADGATVDVTALRPGVVVLNTWYAGCAPCRGEAPVLQAASERYADAGVHVVGINVRDSSPAVVANFQERHGVTYPSILDTEGQAALALRGFAPGATPVTVVVDRQGRVAARVAGEVDASVLDGLIEDVLAEETSIAPAPAPGP
ncbi:TlpA family protein disulfide reductase [Kineococcus sp. SYSU DK002]|uniref:TlpA family protein disulfide reductase n=1 Tax=Kineococcus sp. SYSU DK002 TaxID=3383123 RepID=UPI003D7CD623